MPATRGPREAAFQRRDAGPAPICWTNESTSLPAGSNTVTRAAPARGAPKRNRTGPALGLGDTRTHSRHEVAGAKMARRDPPGGGPSGTDVGSTFVSTKA